MLGLVWPLPDIMMKVVATKSKNKFFTSPVIKDKYLMNYKGGKGIILK